MLPLPDRILATDWSGAKGEHKRHKGIAVADWREGEPTQITVGYARAQLCDWLIEQRARTPRMVVGFDFSFSFPYWFASQCGATIDEVWSAAVHEGEDWLTHIEDPFWRRKRPASNSAREPLRQTDLAGQIGSPKSIFQLVGNGQVGAGSVRGMPYLAALHKAGFAIWPFHTSTLPLVVEIYPTACYVDGVRGGASSLAAEFEAAGIPLESSAIYALHRSQDARDAACALLRMIQHRACFARLPLHHDKITLLEGRIWRAGECCALDSK